MPSRPSISTRTGDDGSTSLLYGKRVPKDHPQIEAVGHLDEFNAALGLARSGCPDKKRRHALERIQRDLIALMGEVACPEDRASRHATSRFARLQADDLARIDAAVAAIEDKNPDTSGWATPGANAHAAALDYARTVARRAERHLVALPRRGRSVRPLLRQYLNRVSDLLWLMAREAEHPAGSRR